MRIHLVCIGTNMPDWVKAGYTEYAKRLPRHCALELVEIAALPRKGRADLARIARDEGRRLIEAIPRHAKVIALTRDGRKVGTPDVAKSMQSWIDDGDDVVLMVGGPEGLSDEVLEHADIQWSLSSLTLAHPLVRVVVAEQLYRAWSVIEGKPYHRGA